MMPVNPPEIFGNASQLATYTHAVLSQMAGVVHLYADGDRAAYAEHVGPHVRHIIEHYETLANALGSSEAGGDVAPVVDYDARERNMQMETDPDVALVRITDLQTALGDKGNPQNPWLDRPLDVRTRGGLQGEHNFSTRSSVARELMFLNSHATHHFAILQGYARQRGETLGAGVGKAPATVAHEQRQREHANA